MEPAAVLAVLVKAQGVGATNAQLATVQKNLEKTDTAGTAMARGMMASGRKVEKAGKAMTKGVTLPLLAIGAASADMALKFDRDMNLIRTQAGASAKETNYLKREVLGLAKASKFGPDEVAEALYRVRSAGFEGNKALSILRHGMQLATLGNSDLEETTKALTGASKSLGVEGSKAMRMLAAEMNATVGTGDMRMEELQAALSTGVLPAFVSAGMGMRDYASALTVMTDRNVPAQVASTRLRTAIAMMVPHSKKAEEALHGVGIETEDLARIMRRKGLPEAIKFLADHLDHVSKLKQNRILIEAFGGAKSSATIATLVENSQELFTKWDHVAEGVHKFNSELKAAEENPLVELQKAWSTIQVALIEIGEVLVPIIVPALIHVADSVSNVVHAFGMLPPVTQKWIIYILMVVAAIGPLLRILGFFMRGAGRLVQILITVAGWFSRTAVASEEAAVAADTVTAANAAAAASYEEVAAAAEMAAVAQEASIVAADAKVGQMAMMMPEASAAGQMSLMAAPATATAAEAAPVAAEAGVAGGVAAGGFASGLAAMLPPALAAIGIANIVSSAVGGDSHGLMFKAGGLAGGALIGGIVGSIVPGIGTVVGALAGAGLGSIAGGFIGKIFNKQDIETQLEKSMRGTAKGFGNALERQSGAIKGMQESSKGIASAQHRVAHAAKAVKMAEHQLAQDRKKFGPTSRAVIRDEVHLAAASDRARHARQQERHAERLHGVQLQLTKRVMVGTVQAEKQRIQTTARSVRSFEEEAKHALKSGAGQKRLEHIQGELTRSIGANRKAHASYNKTLSEAAKLVGPHYAQRLKKVKTVNEEIAQAENKASRKFARSHSLITTTLQQSIGAWKHQQGAAKKTQTSYEKTKGALGPFRSETHTKMHQATKDVEEFATAGSKGLQNFAGQLNSFAGQLGISASHFSVTGKGGKGGKGPKKQTGGMVVPGGGTGDRVPLTAFVEPGEVVHVLNSRASKDIKKLGALERLNSQTPRFQEGGAMGGTAAALATAQRIDAENFPYSWGGGHGGFSGPFDCSGAVSAVLHAGGWLNKPMVSGELASFGAAGPGPITIYANGVHTFMEIMGRFFGTSGSNPGGGAGFFPSSVGQAEAKEGDSGGAFQVRHPIGAGMIGGNISPVAFNGPAGKLTDMGGNAMKTAQGMSSEWLQKHMPGKFGGGDANIFGSFGPGKIVGASTYHPDASTGTVGAAGESLIGKMAFAELGMGTLLGHLPFHSKLLIDRGGKSVVGEKLDIGAGGDAVDGHTRAIDLWYQTAEALGLPRDWLGLVKVSQATAKAQQGGLLGLQKGGSAKAGKDKKGKGSIAKTIKRALKGLSKGKNLPKYHASIRKAGRSIEGIGVSKARAAQLGDATKDVEKFSEFASGASTLTRSQEGPTGEEEVVLGMFKGRNEAEWLNEQLGALLRLRRQLVSTHDQVETNQLPRVNKLMKEAKARLNAVRKAIREAEQKKREIEKQVKEVEQAAKKTKQKLESEVKGIENELQKASGAKNPDKGTLESLRGQIKLRKEAMGGGDKKTTDEVRELNKQIQVINEKNKGRKRVEGALSGTIIPDLESKQEGMHETLAGLYNNGGEIWKIPYMDLQNVQGLGSSTELDIQNPPPIGSLGGEVFTVQNRLREINEEAEKANLGSSGESDSQKEIKELEREIELIKLQRETIQQTQTPILNSFASVQTIAAPPTLPYAGAFARGGVMMAEVGERGREIVAAPQGSRVIPSHEARAALAKGNGDINFEEVNFHEKEGKVVGRANGQPFEKDVKDVNRKQSRKSMSRTPGGKGIKR
jgi:TP901 family phage tail tape measure protein